jgi:hypothetical protein
MSATSSSSDKYLFLFRTDNDTLDPVKTVLQSFYKYPTDSAHFFEITSCNNFKPAYESLILSLMPGTPPACKNPDPLGKVPAGESKKNTLIVIISGDADSSGLKTGGATISSSITWIELRKILKGIIEPAVGLPKTYLYQQNTEVHIFFLSPFCNSFLSECTSQGIPVTSGTMLVPQSSMDTYSTTHQALRNTFLFNLAEELKLNTFTALDTYGRISFNDIAAALPGVTTGTDFKLIAPNPTDKYFPGYSWFEIEDGDPDWFRSPDIKIKHSAPYNTAEYEQRYLKDSSGYLNTIDVQVKIIGTHPVKSFKVDLGVFKDTEVIGADEPTVKSVNTVAGVHLPGYVTVPDVSFNTVQLLFENFNAIVARATNEGDSEFSDTDPEQNDYEAELAISYFPVAIPLTCSATSSPASSSTIANGTIDVSATGGYSTLNYAVDRGQTQTNPHFGSQSSGLHHVTVTDSASPSTICECDVTVGISGGVIPCDSLLDNNYLNICRKSNGDLKFTFKKFPHIPRGYYRSRMYKIRWKSPIPNSGLSLINSDFIRLTHMTIVSTGVNYISGIYYPYVILRVSANSTGELLLKHPGKLSTGTINLSGVPVSIFFRRVFGIWPWPWRHPWHWPWRWPWDWHLSWPWKWPWPWRWPWLWPWLWYIRIARFRLNIFSDTYDLVEF